MALLYKIREWNELFEIAQSRKVDGPLDWVAVPTKHDGLGFRRIMAMPNGQAIYCAWILILQIAAKCQTRGILADENGPLDSSDFAIKTGCPQAVFDDALNVLCGNRIGWIVVSKWESDGSRLPTHYKTEQDITGQDTTGNCVEPATPTATPPADPASICYPDFPCAAGKRSKARTWQAPDALMTELEAAFPAIDVLAEAHKAHAWIIANLERRKTAGGMPSFLNRWMTRAQDRGGKKLQTVESAASRIGTKEDARNWNSQGAAPE